MRAQPPELSQAGTLRQSDGLRTTDALAAARSIWWVRHGQSVGNAGERTASTGAYSLTVHGFAQAQCFAERLERAPSLILVSPYTRAQQTAVPTIGRFPKARVEEWPIHEINYLAAERCAGTTQLERRLLAREFWKLGDPDFVDGIGAESFAQSVSRAREALARLQQQREEFTLIFSHGVFMRIVHWLALTQRPIIDAAAMALCYDFVRGWDVSNCGVLPMLALPDGRLFTGSVTDPTGTAGPPATAEEIQLSGL